MAAAFGMPLRWGGDDSDGDDDAFMGDANGAGQTPGGYTPARDDDVESYAAGACAVSHFVTIMLVECVLISCNGVRAPCLQCLARSDKRLLTEELVRSCRIVVAAAETLTTMCCCAGCDRLAAASRRSTTCTTSNACP